MQSQHDERGQIPNIHEGEMLEVLESQSYRDDMDITKTRVLRESWRDTGLTRRRYRGVESDVEQEN
jgi:protein-disulfide isomerase-like protein with CxxC motif